MPFISSRWPLCTPETKLIRGRHGKAWLWQDWLCLLSLLHNWNITVKHAPLKLANIFVTVVGRRLLCTQEKKKSQLGPCSFGNMKNGLARSSKSFFAKPFLTRCCHRSVQHLIWDTWRVPVVVNVERIGVNSTLRLMPSGEPRLKTIQ